MTILGNHDHWASTPRSLYWLEKSGQSLRYKTRAITRGNDRLHFAGFGDLWHDRADGDYVLNKIPATECRIVLDAVTNMICSSDVPITMFAGTRTR